MALMAVRGEAGLSQFNESTLHDPMIQEVMKKVHLLNDPDLKPKARIELTCKDGAVLIEEPVCRSLTVEEVRDKFIKNMSPVLKEKQIHDLLSSVENLEKAETITELTHLFKRKTIRRDS